MSEIDKRVGPNKVVQVFFSQKNNKVWCTIIWQVRVLKTALKCINSVSMPMFHIMLGVGVTAFEFSRT